MEAAAAAGGEGASWYLAVQGSDMLTRTHRYFFVQTRALERSEVEDQLTTMKSLTTFA